MFVEQPPGELLDALGEAGALDALWLSLRTTAAAMVADRRRSGRRPPTSWPRAASAGRGAVITLIELPLVLPPAVAGIALLAAVGPAGLLGGAVEDAGIELVLETAGVVVALTFVAAPFHLRQARPHSRRSTRRCWTRAAPSARRRCGPSLRVAIPPRCPGSSRARRSRSAGRSASSERR